MHDRESMELWIQYIHVNSPSHLLTYPRGRSQEPEGAFVAAQVSQTQRERQTSGLLITDGQTVTASQAHQSVCARPKSAVALSA